IASLNRLVCRNVEGDRFITGIFALIDPARHTCSYVNTGHPFPLLIRPGGIVKIIESEPVYPLGVEEGAAYMVNTVELSPTPSTMFMYTDGVPDAANEQGALFGEQKMLDTLRNASDKPPREQITDVRRLVNQFTRGQPQNDDITMVAIRLGDA